MFVLLNKKLNKLLKHQGKVWCTDDKEEAEDFLDSAKECAIVLGMKDTVDHLTVIEITSEDIK